MLTEAKDVDRHELAHRVGQQYGLSLSTPTFLPVGEESYAYLARAEEGAKYFIRLAENARQEAVLEAAYGVVERLGRTEGLSALVAPQRTRADRHLCTHGRYLVALFPFIEGRSLSESRTRQDRPDVAKVVVALHESEVPAPDLPRTGLENPFEAPIRRALARAESPMSRANRYQRRLGDLLTAHRNDVEETLRKAEDFREAERELVGEWVLTHGEPHLDNFVKDPQGRLHLTDCGDLAYGPPERDLFAFVGPDFDRYLRPYLARRPAASLEPELFEFYSYRWALQEIADYSTRILFRGMGPKEDAHSWEELQDYLPTRHDEIARAVGSVRDVLDRVSAEGRGRHA